METTKIEVTQSKTNKNKLVKTKRSCALSTTRISHEYSSKLSALAASFGCTKVQALERVIDTIAAKNQILL